MKKRGGFSWGSKVALKYHSYLLGICPKEIMTDDLWLVILITVILIILKIKKLIVYNRWLLSASFIAIKMQFLQNFCDRVFRRSLEICFIFLVVIRKREHILTGLWTAKVLRKIVKIITFTGQEDLIMRMVWFQVLLNIVLSCKRAVDSLRRSQLGRKKLRYEGANTE